MQDAESTAIWTARVSDKNRRFSGKSGAAGFGPFGVIWGRFSVVSALKTPVFGLNSTKFDYGFEVVLLIVKELSGIFE
jgi:hypothetical protein